MRPDMLAFVMHLDYPDARICQRPASDRRSAPRALCMLQPPLAAPGWDREAVAHAGMGEPIDPPAPPRERRDRPTCLSGQTDNVVEWLLACHFVGRADRTGGFELRLDLLPLPGRVPRVDPTLDISLAEQRHLLHLAARGDALTHFQRLGAAPTTDQGELRRAYLATCQRLHPDRYFGREIGEFAGLLVDQFHRARAAHAYLSDRQRCAAYLRQLAEAGHTIELADAASYVVLRGPQVWFTHAASRPR